MVFVNPAYAFERLGVDLLLKTDEMWSFVGKKKSQHWLWWVEELTSGEVIAFTFGRPSHRTFQLLKKLLTSAGIVVDQWLTDQWSAYQDGLEPQEGDADKGELQSLERKHLTLRIRIKRLARKTICFSKSILLHNTIIGLFINQYFFGLYQLF